MAKISDIPLNERPREKALRYGLEKLSDKEILAIIISNGTKSKSAIDIAEDIINDSKSIYLTSKLPYQYFKKFPGLSDISALKLAAVFELNNRINKGRNDCEHGNKITSSLEVIQMYADHYYSLQQEEVMLIILNRYRKILYETTLYVGNENNVNCSNKEIFKTIFLHNGTGFYIIHNHPNDAVNPSAADMIFTAQLEQEAKKLHLTMHDHLIIGKNKAYSFSQRRIIDEKEIDN